MIKGGEDVGGHDRSTKIRLQRAQLAEKLAVSLRHNIELFMGGHISWETMVANEKSIKANFELQWE